MTLLTGHVSHDPHEVSSGKHGGCVCVFFQLCVLLSFTQAVFKKFLDCPLYLDYNERGLLYSSIFFVVI